ncbi:SulP family inorganic anion transporter, partial [Corallococcus sicarius]|uniref:SulP family inorganic anion transporter n=1 Tax=Corallococcus sicarius TaxID=2316726 RepID=UPI001FCA3C25
MRLCAALTAATLLSACTTTYAIPKSELVRLDGFKDDNAALLRELGDVMLNRPNDRSRAVRDVEGDTHKFTADTPLALVGPPKEPEELRFRTEEQRFIALGVDATRFQGVPIKPDSQPVIVPMAEVDHGTLREFSLGKTLLLTGGIGRSAANINAGAKTRWSAVLHAVWMLAFITLLGGLASYVP